MKKFALTLILFSSICLNAFADEEKDDAKDDDANFGIVSGLADSDAKEEKAKKEEEGEEGG